MASDQKWYPPEQHPDYVSPLAKSRPGWWVATDGNWYPPEQHPDYVAPTPAPLRLVRSPESSAVSVGSNGHGPGTAPAVNGSANGTADGPGGRETASEAAMEKVRRLGGMLEAGRLSDREFQQMRKEILGL
jgi:hypothetical protein